MIIYSFQLIFSRCTTRYWLCLTWNPSFISQACYFWSFYASCSFYFWSCNCVICSYSIESYIFLSSNGEVFTILCNFNVIAIDELNCVATLNFFCSTIVSHYIPCCQIFNLLFTSWSQVAQVFICCVVNFVFSSIIKFNSYIIAICNSSKTIFTFNIEFHIACAQGFFICGTSVTTQGDFTSDCCCIFVDIIFICFNIASIFSDVIFICCYLIIYSFQLIFSRCTTRYWLCLTWNPSFISQASNLRCFNTSCSFYFRSCNSLVSSYIIECYIFLSRDCEIFTCLSDFNVIPIDKLNCVATLYFFSSFAISYYIPSSQIFNFLLTSWSQVAQIFVSSVIDFIFSSCIKFNSYIIASSCCCDTVFTFDFEFHIACAQGFFICRATVTT